MVTLRARTRILACQAYRWMDFAGKTLQQPRFTSPRLLRSARRVTRA
jgi:hypothetical protein